VILSCSKRQNPDNHDPTGIATDEARQGYGDGWPRAFEKTRTHIRKRPNIDDKNNNDKGGNSMPAVRRDRRRAQPRWVTAWFFADAIVALAPPLYWAFDGNRTPIFGVPIVVLYFIAVSACIATSIVAAYFAEAFRGEID
jgi:hypothetical protein